MRSHRGAVCALAFLGLGCGTSPQVVEADAGDAGSLDAATTDAGSEVPPFAQSVVSFTPGTGAGFGQDRFPDIVLGPPVGAGSTSGSIDVLSLGEGGEIVLGFGSLEIVDGAGPDFIVFENPFGGWIETGIVAVSEDGASWSEFPCAAEDKAGGYPGCAGVRSVSMAPDGGFSFTDPAVAGGDPFDLAQLGVARAKFVRIRDSGKNTYRAPGGGFDLDAVSVIHSQATP
ncbi:MAG: cell surface protein [Myxococcales bacterium]